MGNPPASNNLKGKVLVIDDAPDTLEILRKLLQYEGYEVIVSLTGEEGIGRAEKERPDVVLLDINLPGIDGTEVLRRLRRINPLQSVIMLTAFATIDNAIQALKEGASDFIKKPFENEHLIHIVKQCIEKYRTLKEKESLQEEVERLSITDNLTGLFNHRHFYKTLGAEIARLKRQKTSLSLLMLDLDRFKAYNDLHGHLEGDKVLRKIGEIIRISIRGDVDSGYRYGGDEFAALLIGASIDQALSIAERIRISIEQSGFESITVSIGLAEFREVLDMEGFVKSADHAMYLSKRMGGNQVSTT